MCSAVLENNVSDLGTKIMCAGLVDEGIAVESIESELKTLKQTVASGKPVCPMCMAEMKPVNYSGYYESFSFWECKCERFEEAEKQTGAFA